MTGPHAAAGLRRGFRSCRTLGVHPMVCMLVRGRRRGMRPPAGTVPLNGATAVRAAERRRAHGQRREEQRDEGPAAARGREQGEGHAPRRFAARAPLVKRGDCRRRAGGIGCSMLVRLRCHRPIALLLGAWFALFSTAAPTAMPCPMSHGVVDHEADSASEAYDAHAAHGAHAPQDAPGDAPAVPCDCDASCCSVPTALIPTPPATVVAVSIVPSRRVVAGPAPRPAATRPHLLPFAQGPPA
jgi:hypothetical protein